MLPRLEWFVRIVLITLTEMVHTLWGDPWQSRVSGLNECRRKQAKHWQAYVSPPHSALDCMGSMTSFLNRLLLCLPYDGL